MQCVGFCILVRKQVPAQAALLWVTHWSSLIILPLPPSASLHPHPPLHLLPLPSLLHALTLGASFGVGGSW